MDKEPAEVNETEVETPSDFDMEAATADISSDLFGQGSEEAEAVEGQSDEEAAEGEKEGLSADSVTSDVTTPSPQTSEVKEGGDNSAAVQATGAPQTWTKEALETWATIPPRAQQEILKREDDFLKGITQYKAAADIGQKYDAVVQPYRPILEATNTDPIQLFQSFAANHYLLTRGTPQQKIELAANMLNGYEIPLPELLEHMAENLSAPPSDPRVSALERELADIRGGITAAQKAEQDRVGERIAKEIEDFAADPAHPYFKELAVDIQQIFAAGLAQDLNEAYEKAVYANPTTRQKELERLTAEGLATAKAEEAKRADKRAKSTADHVTSIPKQKNGTVPVGSIDDTLNETMAAINARG